MPERRQLRFDTLDDIVRDAENLLAKGYDKAGQWDLGQCSGHLANWMGYAMDGFPRPPVLLRPMMWMLRYTVGPRMFRKYLAKGEFSTGGPTMPESIPQAGGDAAGVARLKENVERMKARTSDPIPSPFFGPMTREEWVRLNCIHSAHHLSFLIPKQG